MERRESKADEGATPRQMLQKAYVLMNFGFFERALAACDEAARRSDEPLVARTLEGAILTASGRPMEAIRHLMPLHRRHRDAILTALYLAEACLVAGRRRRGFKILDGLDDNLVDDSPWASFADELRQTWQQLDEVDDLPQPLTVPLGEQPVVAEST